MDRLRSWLRGWLGIQSLSGIQQSQASAIGVMQAEIKELRAEVTRFQIAQYVPPKPEEPQRKVIQANTMKQFYDIYERELEAQEVHSAD